MICLLVGYKYIPLLLETSFSSYQPYCLTIDLQDRLPEVLAAVSAVLIESFSYNIIG